MNEFGSLWEKLGASKRYREEFVAAQLKRGVPFQIRAQLKRMGLSQEELASRAGISQGVVSRSADPNYGNLTLNTIIRIAAGFDVAFIGRFVPFSELARWFTELSEKTAAVRTFSEESMAPGTREFLAVGAGAEAHVYPARVPAQIPGDECGCKSLLDRQRTRQTTSTARQLALIGAGAEQAGISRLG